jgi:hypothetical protein
LIPVFPFDISIRPHNLFIAAHSISTTPNDDDDGDDNFRKLPCAEPPSAPTCRRQTQADTL